VTLVRNDNYWNGEPPAIDGVTLRQVNDSTTALQLVERGEVDIAQNLDKDLAPQIEANPDLTLQSGQGLQIIYLALSPGFPDSPLADARVRRAMMLAVDYDGIINGLLGGFAARPAGVVPVGILGAADAEQYRYERDVEAARALLEEAGFADGFELTINMPSSPLGGLSPDILAAKLVADLGEIGITVNPVIEADSVFREGRNAGEYQAWVTRFSADFFDPSNWTALFTIPRFFNIAYYAKVLDEGLQAAAVETIVAEDRAAAVAEYTRLLNDFAAYSVLYQPQTVDAVSAAVSGYQFHPVALIRYAGLSK
jgi:peptide/nickel transport system substrate-binding protein